MDEQRKDWPLHADWSGVKLTVTSRLYSNGGLVGIDHYHEPGSEDEFIYLTGSIEVLVDNHTLISADETDDICWIWGSCMAASNDLYIRGSGILHFAERDLRVEMLKRNGFIDMRRSDRNRVYRVPENAWLDGMSDAVIRYAKKMVDLCNSDKFTTFDAILDQGRRLKARAGK